MIKVLMVGPSRKANGGIASVINEYYRSTLVDSVHLDYIESVDNGTIFYKFFLLLKSIIKYFCVVDKYQIVHIHMSKKGSFYRKYLFTFLAHKKKKKILLHIHSSQFIEFYRNTSKRVRGKIHSAFNMADSVIVLSEFWKSEFISLVDEKKIIVLPNGVQYAEDINKEYTNKNILFMGKVCEGKGIYWLLDTFKNIIVHHPDAHLYIGGLGEIDICHDICKKSNILSNVTFLGWINGKEKIEYLEKCSIFVLPSYTEGMPVSLLEAMSYGCACVATNVGGIPEVLVDESGIMIDVSNKRELYDGIHELLCDSNRRMVCGKKSRLIIKEEYNIESIVKRLLQIYSNTL